jgi:cytosine/creatinine deaminase
MTFDLVFRNARIAGKEDRTVDIGIHGGRFAAIEANLPEAGEPTQDLAGRLITPGLVETHIHLDKSCLLGRCNCERGTLDEAIAEVA